MDKRVKIEFIGDYEYHSKNVIGHGAFSTVYRGNLQNDSTNIVAIKIVSKQHQVSHASLLLEREMEVLRKLSALENENIVRLLDTKITPKLSFLVMEYCNGGDLGYYIRQKVTLTEETIRLFLCQLANAFKSLHKEGIVHRDLKPANILMHHQGGPIHKAPPEELNQTHLP